MRGGLPRVGRGARFEARGAPGAPGRVGAPVSRAQRRQLAEVPTGRVGAERRQLAVAGTADPLRRRRGEVLCLDLSGSQLAPVHRGVADRAGKRPAGLARPARGDGAAEVPVPGVGLGAGDGARGNLGAVDVHVHPVTPLRDDGEVPAAVVVRTRAGDDVVLTRPGAEQELAAIGHVQDTVVAGVGTGWRVAEPRKRAPAAARGLEPQLLWVGAWGRLRLRGDDLATVE